MSIGPAMPPIQGESGAPFVASVTEVVPPAPEPSRAADVTPESVPKGTTVMHDAIHVNVPTLPHGFQNAGYTTGSADIQWTKEDWDAHPVAVRICQDKSASDTTADVLDVESGAATPAECAAWARSAAANYLTSQRKGQRSPLIYMSADSVTSVVNALIQGGIKSGIGLWVANFNLTQNEALAMLNDGSGPFPVRGVQYTDNPPHGTYDTSVMSSAWLEDRANKSQWLKLTNIPHNAPVFYNEKEGTLGYLNTAGKWTKVTLP
jgi:hypothetical protein